MPSWPSGRASDVATRLEEAERRASEAALRVSELELKIDTLQAELTAWEAMPEVRRHAWTRLPRRRWIAGRILL